VRGVVYGDREEEREEEEMMPYFFPDSKLDQIADDLSMHKLVPFFGAGASFDHLKLDWNSICSDMNVITGISEKDNLKSAQLFIDKFGRDSFADFLKKHLIIDEFDDNLGETFFFLMALNCYHYYTTNQDNVFEKCLEKYNRQYQIVSVLETFKQLVPYKQTIFKFHGDLHHPESIVFSSDDYKRRMPESKELSLYDPLDIMLISDTIINGILFVGYSFRDSNIIELFNHIAKIFNGNPPKSYLIQHYPDNEFEEYLKKYNITCIDCTKYFPDKSIKDAYSAALSYLSNKAFGKKTAQEIDNLFFTDKFEIIPIKTPYEIDNFLDYVNYTNDDTKIIIEKFRSVFDLQNIPKSLSKKIEEIFIKIINRVNTCDELFCLHYATGHLNLPDIGCAFNIVISYYCKLNDFYVEDAMQNISMFQTHMPNIPSNLNNLFVAMALEKLMSLGKNVSNLLHCITFSIHSKHDIEDLPDDEQNYIKHHFSVAFNKEKRYSNPLNSDFSFWSKVSFEDIAKRMESSMPRRNKNEPL
jgi:hypothetical protein